ncbi:MAG: hypothetical protein JO051_08255 [Acidobacteriaceae bacterium]|nr:hypothetical protein [Acidobacteriaceae bacterium]
MTIDERIAFLVQSTESLHATAAALTSQTQELTTQTQELTAQVREHTKQLQIDAENIRRLATIAAAHEERLEGLEGGDTA